MIGSFSTCYHRSGIQMVAVKIESMQKQKGN